MVLPNIYLRLIEQSKIKILLRFFKSEDFLLMTYIENTSYFEVAPAGHTIAYKNIDNLLKFDYFMS